MVIHTVELNYDKCREDNINPNKVWNKIKEIYARYDMKNEDNMFIADFEDDDYTKEALAVQKLSFCEWFFTYVSSWISVSEEDGRFNLYEFYKVDKRWELRKKALAEKHRNQRVMIGRN